MDAGILNRFNDVIRPGDILYHLGDVSWSTYDIKRNFLDKLNTKEVHLILGNHDTKDPKVYRDMGFRSVQDYKEIRMDVVRGTPDVPGSSFPVVLSHYPMRSWNRKGYGAFQLYGHCHGKLPDHDRSMDVGVDTNNFYPYSWDEIKSKLSARPIFSDKKEIED